MTSFFLITPLILFFGTPGLDAKLAFARAAAALTALSGTGAASIAEVSFSLSDSIATPGISARIPGCVAGFDSTRPSSSSRSSLSQSNLALCLSRNSNLVPYCSDLEDFPQRLMSFRMLSGIGRTLIVLRTTTLPVRRSKHLTEPCRFPDGPRAIQLCVRSAIVLVMSASLLASTYAPKRARQSFFISSFLLVTISRGEYFSETPDASGTAFSIITTK